MLNRLKRIAYVTIALALLFGPLTALTPEALAQAPSALDEVKSRGTLRVGWGVWWPYIYRDPQTKELRGLDVDLFNELTKQMGVKLEFVEDSWATIIAGLQAKKFDVLLPLVPTPPRLQAATFSKPVFRVSHALMVNRKDVGKYQGWQDLDKPDKQITLSLGTATDIQATEKFKRAQIRRLKALPDSVSDLLSGKADAWATTADSLAFIQKEHPELVVLPNSEFGHNDMGFIVRQGDNVFRDWLNRFIDEQRTSGSLLKMLERNGLNASFLAN